MVKRILLIDDDKEDAELFEDALGEVDKTASFVYMDNPREALDQLTQLHIQLPDMIFLDINMPSISGWECLKELKKHDTLKEIPVIMYSTSSYQREGKIALERGATAFMTKPYDFIELKENIQGLICTL
ncbi:response regulator [soil metagenome]